MLKFGMPLKFWILVDCRINISLVIKCQLQANYHLIEVKGPEFSINSKDKMSIELCHLSALLPFFFYTQQKFSVLLF